MSTDYLENQRTISRRVKAGLTFVGVAAAAVFALYASPSAIADTAELPGLPVTIGPETVQASYSLPPLLIGEEFDSNASYTDLLGVTVTTQEPGQWNFFGLPGALPVVPSFTDTNSDVFHGESLLGDVDGVLGHVNGNAVGADTFGFTDTSPGLFNLYEETPVIAADGMHVQNYDDALVFDPTGNPLTDASGIAFGIQYIDLPSALNPVDQINILGHAGEILLSIPVTGDLFSL